MTEKQDWPDGVEGWKALEKQCFDEGLLKHGFGKQPVITKKGRELVKQYAAQDEEVLAAVGDALKVRLIDRRDAFVTLLEFVVLRRDGRV